jgi:MFS family permease
MASAQIFIYNSPTKLTTDWFPEKERSIATTIGTSANIIGILLGFVLPGIFVDTYNSEIMYTESDFDKYRMQIKNLQLCIAGLATFFSILCLLFFKDGP